MHPKIFRLQIGPAIKGYEANLPSLELVDFKTCSCNLVMQFGYFMFEMQAHEWCGRTLLHRLRLYTQTNLLFFMWIGKSSRLAKLFGMRQPVAGEYFDTMGAPGPSSYTDLSHG